MQRILLLDNFDSFTYNLCHYLEQLDVKVDVFRNDDIIPSLEKFDKVVLSPGPGLPENAGCMTDLINRVKGVKPVLGVCLGMQAIAQVLGGDLYNQENVKHGLEETIYQNGSFLYKDLPKELQVGLYHSWAVKKGKGVFRITAVSKDDIVMSIENEALKLYGVQFHPESIMTPEGLKILQNFLNLQ